MSTSQGNPSTKLSWFKSMNAKLDRQTKLYSEAVKMAENDNYTTKLAISEKSNSKAQFAEMLAEAKAGLERKKAKKTR